MRPVVYTEHLVNIHTLRVQIWLTSESNDDTVILLSPDGIELTVQHDGENNTITLPARLLIPKQALDLPSTPTRILNFRFRLPLEQSAGDGRRDVGASNFVPWTARLLSSQTEIRCSSCRTTVLPEGLITNWQDLPNEGWAEMMEFWHCHKPNEHDVGHELHKGYSANSKLNIRSHFGLVSATSFLFEPKDLSNVQNDGANISCSTCSSILGTIEEDNGAARISKHALAISTSPALEAVALPQAQWSACSLLTTMESQGTSRLTALSPDRALSIWLFAPDMAISATFTSSRPTRVMKVMWKEVSLEEASASGDAMNRQAMATGTLEISSHEHEILRCSLAETHESLPQDMQRFQDWHVSLLPKFTLDNVG